MMDQERNKDEVSNDLSNEISVREAGRRGGQSTLNNQGTEFFQKIGRKGGQQTAKLYRELLSEFGRRGGRHRRPTLDKLMGKEDHR